MTAKRTDMHRLQELVRLHRLETGAREAARLLGLSPNTERRYREALAAAGLLQGPTEAIPALEELKAAVLKHAPPAVPRQQQIQPGVLLGANRRPARQRAGPDGNLRSPPKRGPGLWRQHRGGQALGGAHSTGARPEPRRRCDPGRDGSG